MAFQTSKDFFLEIAKGNVPKHSVVIDFGRNNDIDTGADEDIWMQGGTFAEPTAARTMRFASSSANDAAAGTGARTVYIEGLDSSYNIATETITLNGTSNVDSVGTYTFINSAYVTTFGSGGTNAGDITITALVDLTVQGKIAAGIAEHKQAIYMVPTGYSAYMTGVSMSIQQATANNSIDIVLMSKTFGSGGYRVRDHFNLTNTGT